MRTDGIIYPKIDNIIFTLTYFFKKDFFVYNRYLCGDWVQNVYNSSCFSAITGEKKTGSMRYESLLEQESDEYTLSSIPKHVL